jgi:hypothetical protein
MPDVDEKLRALYDIARERDIMVIYDRLPYEDSFITKLNGKSYIYLDTRLSGIKELVQLTHEIGHDYYGISTVDTPEWLDDKYEKKAWTWAATYLVSYIRYSEVMRDPFVDSDAEAANKLNVSIKILHKARDYYHRIGLPVSKADIEYVHRKKMQNETGSENPNVSEYEPSESEELQRVNVPRVLDRVQSKKQYANISRLKYKDYARVMKQPNIMYDIEAAEELYISVGFLRRAREIFLLKGLHIRQYFFVTDWRNWNY